MGSDGPASYPGKELEAMSFAGNYHRWIVEELAPHLRGRVAEVGAGIGSMSRLLLGEALDALWAFEPSPNLFPRLERELAGEPRATAVNGFLDAGLVAGGFDAITYINVLEHIEDDRGEMALAFAALKPGGRLLVFVPALPWLYGEVDRQVGHFRRYTRSRLEEVVKGAGFAIERSHYFDAAGILPWWIAIVVLRRGLGGASVSLYDKVAVPATRFVERIVRPPLGKNLVLVAHKR